MEQQQQPMSLPEMADYFDFGEAAMPEAPVTTVSDMLLDPIPAEVQHSCPSHPNADGCLCHGFMDDFGVPDELLNAPPENENFNDFAAWIPRYYKPDVACTYCQSKGLVCFITHTSTFPDGTQLESQSCSACNALLRPCSFSQPAKPRGAMDTLHTVTEDACQEFGALTGIKTLRSWDRSGVDPHAGEADRLSRKSGTRFPKEAVRILKDWMNAHADDPYPTEEEKKELELKTGLKPSQIANWLANTRRRRKSRVSGTASPTMNACPTNAMDIVPNAQGVTHSSKSWEKMNPFERWQHSPPENEPARASDIARALADAPPTEPDSSGRPSRQHSSEGSSCFSMFKAPSTTSLETGWSAISSGSLSNKSYGSGYSHGSRNSYGSYDSGVKKERRRRRRTAPKASRPELAQAPRLFQCTFCTDTFKNKYDWSRHEKSLHLSLEKWICAPLGPIITDPVTGQKKCTYCDALNPSKKHLESHNHSSCEEKGMDSRTFYRKDHLRQHLRLVHGCKMTSSMDSWKSEATYIKCRCGFCGGEFTKWTERVDHLAKHYRNGATMKDWKGCRGLDPAVAAQVTNAMPPYLIANESKSPFPFSASNKASLNHHLTGSYAQGNDLEATIPGVSWPSSGSVPSLAQAGSSSSSLPTPQSLSSPSCIPITEKYPHLPPGATTCWEILTIRLGEFVKEQVERGVKTITDAELQKQARYILFDDDDPWNQTAADNPEWLRLFKQAHGLSEGLISQSDLIEDLGIGVGELSFDHFFTQQTWDALPDLSWAENPQ